jgi:hypothetical protein
MKVLLAIFLVLMMWLCLDLATPSHTQLRQFNPKEVAHIETQMWRAYYEHRSVYLFHLLGTLLREQYGLSFWKSELGAYYATRAAVVFQRGQSRADYEQALPDLRRYYAMIRRGSDVPFNSDRAAEKELEWWIAHRNKRPDLAATLAALQGELYQTSPEPFDVHAQARARAMIYRDEKGSSITNEDWARIESWLDNSWSSLYQQVKSN